jgi:hypothetical protein
MCPDVQIQGRLPAAGRGETLYSHTCGHLWCSWDATQMIELGHIKIQMVITGVLLHRVCRNIVSSIQRLGI